MAILDDFTAQVVVDGEPLKEYDDDDEETDGDSEDDDITEWRNIFHHASVSKYIESISNARFKIMVKVSPAWEFDSDFISFDLFLDGQYVTNVLCEKGYTDNETIDAVTVSSPTGPLLKQFIFCEIKPCEFDSRFWRPFYLFLYSSKWYRRYGRFLEQKTEQNWDHCCEGLPC